MVHRDIGGWDGATEPAQRDIEGRPAGTRRAVLGAASGLALAASGLFLPEWLQETEARRGALDGAKGGRRGKNRRGRHKQRNHGDKKDKNRDKPRGRDGLELRSVALLVHNYRPFAVQVQGWQYERLDDYLFFGEWGFRQPTGWEESTIQGRTGQPHFTREFISTSTWAAVQVGTDRIVWGRNLVPPFWPTGTIVSGGWNKDGWTGGDKLAQADLFVNSRIATDGISITRVDDTNDHIRFSVDLI